MTKHEKQKRREAMRKIDQKADYGGHNRPMRERHYSELADLPMLAMFAGLTGRRW